MALPSNRDVGVALPPLAGVALPQVAGAALAPLVGVPLPPVLLQRNPSGLPQTGSARKKSAAGFADS